VDVEQRNPTIVLILPGSQASHIVHHAPGTAARRHVRLAGIRPDREVHAGDLAASGSGTIHEMVSTTLQKPQKGNTRSHPKDTSIPILQ
jgi:hypothetical protein